MTLVLTRLAHGRVFSKSLASTQPPIVVMKKQKSRSEESPEVISRTIFLRARLQPFGVGIHTHTPSFRIKMP